MPEKGDPLAGTRLDERLHRPRLKSGLVPARTRIYLCVVEGSDKGKVFDLSTGGRYLIGRGAGDVPLSDAKVSSKHAEVQILGPDGHFLVDLASTNGTFLNGARVERQRLRHGDLIRAGDTVLRLDVIEETLPLSPP